MQGEFSKKSRTAVTADGKQVYEMEYACAEPSYPQSFLDIVKVWKHLVMKEGVSPSGAAFEGSGIGGALVIAACLWCRDHGIPLPSSITLSDPVVAPCGGVAIPYFSQADIDDPCAYPLIADFYGFPPVNLILSEDFPYAEQADAVFQRMKDHGVECSSGEEMIS